MHFVFRGDNSIGRTQTLTWSFLTWGLEMVPKLHGRNVVTVAVLQHEVEAEVICGLRSQSVFTCHRSLARKLQHSGGPVVSGSGG